MHQIKLIQWLCFQLASCESPALQKLFPPLRKRTILSFPFHAPLRSLCAARFRSKSPNSPSVLTWIRSPASTKAFDASQGATLHCDRQESFTESKLISVWLTSPFFSAKANSVTFISLQRSVHFIAHEPLHGSWLDIFHRNVWSFPMEDVGLHQREFNSRGRNL